MGKIYKIYNDINDKLYIGKTLKSLESRFQDHKRDSQKENKEKRPLYNAMKKYGIQYFHIELLEDNVDINFLSEREQYWISYYNSYYNGYNATLGGDGKILYDYKIIAEKYLELKNEQQVADFFHCDRHTVRKACENYNIKIISSQEIAKLKQSKKIAQLDKDTEEIIHIYDSISEAFRALNKTKSGGIAKACKENKVYIGYKWKYI